MRGLRSTIALIVVLAGLGAYIYFVTWKKPETDTGPKQEKMFPALQADKIDDLTITAESGDVTALQKKGTSWQIVSPVSAPADDSEVSGITNALSQVEVARVVDENPSNLADYGLTKPRIAVDFKTGNGKAAERLLIGEKSPTGADLFAQRDNDKKVFLIQAFQETTFNRTTFDLREKTLIKFDRDKVDGIDIESGGKTLQLAKNGTDWMIVKPIAARADFGSVEGLIGRLVSAQMKSIVTGDASPADLKKDGFDKPSVTVHLKMASAEATLVIGNKGEGSTYYARDASTPVVVTVDDPLVDDLKKGVDEYRRKDIFEFRAYNADRLEITRNGQTIVFEKVKGQGTNPEDKWRRVSPNPADVNKDNMESLLSRLSNMHASSFVESTANTGLDKPAMSVSVKFDDGKKDDHASFGQVGQDVYVARPGEPGAAKGDMNDFNEAIKALDALSK